MDPNFKIDDDRSDQLPSVDEARMMHAEQSRRQSFASLSKASDIETAYSGSVDTGEHDQLPSVDDVRMNSPRRSSNRCRVMLLGALIVIAVVIVTVALVVTQAGTEDDEFNLMEGGGAYPDNTVPRPPSTTEVLSTPTPTTSAPQSQEPSTPHPTEATATPVDRYEQILKVLTQRDVTPLETLMVKGSNEQKAAEWISDTDSLAVSVDDADALVQRYIITLLFYSMGGESWSNRLNFLSTEDVCKWYISGFAGDNKALKQFGITCNEEGKITDIHFPSSFLSGPFPFELSKLTNLQRLEVFNNALITGGFPEFLKGMPKISYLGLHYCGLQGQLPTWLGSLTSLTSLVLSNNQLTGTLPTSMAQLTNLEDLYLDDNRLQGGIGVLTGFSTLENLVIEDNAFEGGLNADMIRSWSSLQVFDASNNKLKSIIPASFFELSNLRILDLHNNEFTGSLPRMTDENASLEMLTLNQNSLSGEIPTEIGYCINLNTIDFSGNSFTSTIPSTLGTLANLEYLFLALNPFEAGEIPTSLSNLVNLKQLSLKGTQRTGTIPSWIGNLNQLILLDLDMNSLTGAIPPAVGDLSRMEYLLLNRNDLVGTIPSTLSSLLGLKFFMIDQNKLTGSAVDVCNYPEMVEMFVADCQGATPEIECSCCNVCCSEDNTKCNDNLWLGDSNPIWELGFERPGVELDPSASRSYTVQFAGDIP